MSPKTLFKSADAVEVANLDEAIASVESNHYQLETVYAEACELRFLPEANEFEGNFDDRNIRFTKKGLLKFCSCIGVPAGFADKVPNELLITNVMKMLESAEKKKIKMIYRNGVLVSAMKPGRCWLKPNQVLEYMAAGLQQRKLVTNRVSITDDGIVANAFETPTTKFDLSPDDPFSLGLRLDYGYRKPGLLEGGFFSLRSVCLNTAYAPRTKAMRHAIQYERIRGTEINSDSFARFHEKLTAPASVIQQLRTAHLALKGLTVLDETYIGLYKHLAKVVGHEPALGIFQVDDARHESILAVVKARQALVESDPDFDPTPQRIEGMDSYFLFNKITSVAQNYKGEDRLDLEELGGTLLPL